MPHVIIDPESRSLDEHFAVIKTLRKGRPRFPAGCVTLVTDAAQAVAGADATRDLHPAVIYGPSISSEGQQVYYLVRWLD